MSLLFAPMQFVAADMATIDHGQMKCEMMDMDGSMEHDMAAQGGCECPDQCKVSCAGAHMSLATVSMLQMTHVNTSIKLDSRTSSITGIEQLTELRPPRKFHA